MSVRIIVDSASDLTKERADALNLDYMPLKTIFGETEYLDGVTISHKEFYEKTDRMWNNPDDQPGIST
mgnify:CR=1 FL=1